MKFRQKIVLSQILLFSFFIAISIPFIDKAILKVLISSLDSSANEIIQDLQKSSSEQEMIHKVEETKGDVFYLLSLYNAQGVRISTERNELLGKDGEFVKDATQDVKEALSSLDEVSIRNSTIYDKEFVFVAMPFKFHRNFYVLHGVFPYEPIKKFSDTFNFWFISLCLVALLIFSVFTWVIFGALHKPIYQIINAIQAYQSGHKEKLPEILSQSDYSKDEDFGKLAGTLRSLYEQVQHQLSELTVERNEKEAILESLGEGVIAVDGEMKVAYVNFVGSKMLGIPKRHLLDKELPDSAQGKNGLLFEKSKHLLLACQKHRTLVTDSLSIDQGTKIYLDLVAAPKSQGRGAIIVLQDKSSQHKVLEMGKDFVANASHELRTPITIIKGFAETLQDMKEMPAEMLTSIVEKIVRNCERMENLVKNLLTLADIENLSISPYQSCDLDFLIENSKQMVETVYTDAEITVENKTGEIMIAADGNILELAIINLLTNAAKYSKPPAKIHISLEKEGDEAKVVIKDQGIGIPPSDLEHIFERFYTVDKAHSRKLGGAGLGLSLVKTIIDKHQGSITVESTLGIGTTFTIILPLARNA